MSPWMMTRFGGFTPLDPKVEDVRLDDIGWALSMIARYGGHARFHYSVGQHSILVAYLLPARLRKAGLLHDSPEAYIGDMPRPLKHDPSMQGFVDAEHRIEQVIEKHFELELTEDDRALVKAADNFALAYEASQRELLRDGSWSKPMDLSTIDPSRREAAAALQRCTILKFLLMAQASSIESSSAVWNLLMLGDGHQPIRKADYDETQDFEFGLGRKWWDELDARIAA